MSDRQQRPALAAYDKSVDNNSGVTRLVRALHGWQPGHRASTLSSQVALTFAAAAAAASSF